MESWDARRCQPRLLRSGRSGGVSPPASRYGRSSRNASTHRSCGSGPAPRPGWRRVEARTSPSRPSSGTRIFQTSRASARSVRPCRARGGPADAAMAAGGRVTFKYGLGEQMISILTAFTPWGWTAPARSRSRGSRSRARDIVAAVLPDPADIGPQLTGKTCAGVLVTGEDKEGNPRRTYLYHVVDNEVTMRDPVRSASSGERRSARSLPSNSSPTGVWKGAGVLGPGPSTPCHSWTCSPHPSRRDTERRGDGGTLTWRMRRGRPAVRGRAASIAQVQPIPCAQRAASSCRRSTPWLCLWVANSTPGNWRSGPCRRRTAPIRPRSRTVSAGTTSTRLPEGALEAR